MNCACLHGSLNLLSNRYSTKLTADSDGFEISGSGDDMGRLLVQFAKAAADGMIGVDLLRSAVNEAVQTTGN